MRPVNKSTRRPELSNTLFNGAVGYAQGVVVGNVRTNVEEMLNGIGDSKDVSPGQFNNLIGDVFNEGLRMLPDGDTVDQLDIQGAFFDGYTNTSEFNRFDDAEND